jgi:hypothetical protein
MELYDDAETLDILHRRSTTLSRPISQNFLRGLIRYEVIQALTPQPRPPALWVCSGSIEANSTQGKVARHGPMIRCIRPSDRGR